MKKLLMIIISTILLGMTGCKSYKSEIDKVEIPNLQIKYNNKNLTVEKGSYDWSIGNESIIADAQSPIQISEWIEGNKVSSKDKLLMKFTKEPTNVSVILWENEKEKINSKDNIIIPQTNGSYVYEVVGHWPNGNVSYTIKLIVKD